MDRTSELISILWIPGLPLVAALIGLLGRGWLARRPGREAIAALRLAIGSSALAGLLFASAFAALTRDPPVARLGEEIGAWLSVGTTTSLRFDLAFDRLAAVLAAPLIAAAFLLQLAAFGRPRTLLLLSLGLGGGLLLVTAKSLVLVALAWHLIGLLALAAADHPSRGQRGALALGDVGFWLALAALSLGAGALDIGQVLRTTLGGEGSRLVVAELGGIGLATLAGVGLVIAVIGRGFGLAPARGHRGPLAGLVAGPLSLLVGAYLLLRMGSVLALAPGLLELVAPVGAGLALLGGARAIRAKSSPEALQRLCEALHGLVLAAIGVHAWAAALVLATVGALGIGALAIVHAGEERGDRRHPWLRAGAALATLALVGAVPLGLLPPLAAIASAGFATGGGGLLVCLAALAYAGLAGLALGRTGRRRFADEAGRSQDAVIAAPVIVLGLLALAGGALDLPPLGGLADASLLGPFLGPSLYQAMTFAPLAAAEPLVSASLALLLLAAGLAGLSLGRRSDPGAAPAGWSRAWEGAMGLGGRIIGAPLAAIDGLEGVLRHLRGRAYLRLWLAATEPRPAALLGLLAGLMAVLGTIYCNPEVVVVGPSGVHPVDLGGLDPRIAAPRSRGLDALKEPAPPPTIAAPPEIKEEYR
ncbi:MAG: hypothetical protein H6710_08205 [Myxococcales bacterium]|nr:hypothetical protein [Myxococcales bacterium]MCB9704230.1 hypothetical protein [Myxococcales bacterium]